MTPDKPYSGLGALGDLAYDVGEGIFRPGGYGGGVFDGNLSGAPALGKRSKNEFRGLGDALSDQQAADATNYPYGKYSAQTLQIQNLLNAKLQAAGFCPLIADGKLGPLTCGASMLVGGLSPGPAVNFPLSCQDQATPRKLADGCGTNPTPTTFPTSNKPSSSSASMQSSLPLLSSSTKKVLGFLGGGLLAVGAVYYVKKRRGMK